VEEAKGKEIYKMIEGIAEWYPLLDPYILAQFPEVAACVGAYYKMALADRKIVSIFMLLDALVDGLDLRFSALKIYSGVTPTTKEVKKLLAKDMANIISDVKTLMYGNYGNEYDSMASQPKRATLNLKKYKSLNKFTGDKNTDKLWQFPATDVGYAASAQKLWPVAMLYDRVFTTAASGQNQSHEVESAKGYTNLSLDFKVPVAPQLRSIMLPGGGNLKFQYNKAAQNTHDGYLPVFSGAQTVVLQELYGKNPVKYQAKESTPSKFGGYLNANASLQSLTSWGLQTEGILISLLNRADIIASLINPYTEEMVVDFDNYFISMLGIPAEIVILLVNAGKAKNTKDLIKYAAYWQAAGYKTTAMTGPELEEAKKKHPYQLNGYYYQSIRLLKKTEKEFSEATNIAKSKCSGLPIEVQQYAEGVAQVEAYAYASKTDSDIGKMLAKYKSAAAKTAEDAADKMQKLTDRKIILDELLQDQIIAVKNAKASGDPEKIIEAENARQKTMAEIGSIVKKRKQRTQIALDAGRTTTRTGFKRKAAIDSSEESLELFTGLLGTIFTIHINNVHG